MEFGESVCGEASRPARRVPSRLVEPDELVEELGRVGRGRGDLEADPGRLDSSEHSPRLLPRIGRQSSQIGLEAPRQVGHGTGSARNHHDPDAPGA